MNVDQRVIALIDMDCFYVQVEQRLQPEFLGKPCGVAQYYTWKGGGLIAVNYEARNFGVRRGMRGEQARELCPEFHVFHVQEVNGKANLTRYRDASADVFRVLNNNFKLVEKASIDEAYLDLTDDVQRLREQRIRLTVNDFPTTHLASVKTNSEDDRLESVQRWLSNYQSDDNRNDDLILGAYLVEQIRKKIKEEVGFFCSAGVARNKILAKLCCGFNKPKRQTVLMNADVDNVFDKTPVQKIQGFGGKAGERVMELFQVEYFGQLRKHSLDVLQTSMGEKDGLWLYNLVRGIETTVVNNRNLYKSISASKNFPGHTRLDTVEKIRLWCQNLSEEVFNRLEKDRSENKRRAKLLTVSFTTVQNETLSRSCPIHEYSRERFAEDAYRILKQFNKSNTNLFSPALINLGLCATKFIENAQSKSIVDLFSKKNSKSENLDVVESEDFPKIDENDETPIEDRFVSNEKPTTIRGDFFEKFQKNFSTEENFPKVERPPTKAKTINSFFSRYSSQKIDDEDENFILCRKCSKSISVWEFPEHEDFHFAQQLQIEENRVQTVSTANVKSNKRKNDQKSSTNQTLDAFLSKKSKT